MVAFCFSSFQRHIETLLHFGLFYGLIGYYGQEDLGSMGFMQQIITGIRFGFDLVSYQLGSLS